MLALVLACDGDRPERPPTTAETGADGPLPRLFDEHHALVVPDLLGLRLVHADGAETLLVEWEALLDTCEDCAGEGASQDGDGLLVSFARGFGAGGVARIGPAGEVDWVVDGLSFPHDAARDPADGTVVVPEASLDRLTWIPGEGASADAVRVVDLATPGWAEEVPNGVDRFDHGGRSWLLSSNRGTVTADGRVVLWDVTDPAAPRLQWKFPADGRLDVPHAPVFRQWEGRWWLLWAHSRGAPDGTSTVGLAVTDDPGEPPRYVADLVPSGPGAPYVFLRGVELTDDGVLLLTDTGTLAGPLLVSSTGRLLRTAMPTGLAPTGATGAVGVDQVLVDLEAGLVLREGLGSPFEGWLWELPE